MLKRFFSYLWGTLPTFLGGGLLIALSAYWARESWVVDMVRQMGTPLFIVRTLILFAVASVPVSLFVAWFDGLRDKAK